MRKQSPKWKTSHHIESIRFGAYTVESEFGVIHIHDGDGVGVHRHDFDDENVSRSVILRHVSEVMTELKYELNKKIAELDTSINMISDLIGGHCDG